MKVFLAITLLLLTSCATTATPVTKDIHQPHKGEVAVFQSESQVPGDYKVIADIERSDFGKYQRLTVEDAIPYLQEKAREVGANAIIIDSSEVIVSGIFSRGINVKGRAIIIKSDK